MPDVQQHFVSLVRSICILYVINYNFFCKKVLSEASLAYEAGLSQRTAATSGQGSSAKSAAAGAGNVNTDNWEKFSVDDDESTGAEASSSSVGSGTGGGQHQVIDPPVHRE